MKDATKIFLEEINSQGPLNKYLIKRGNSKETLNERLELCTCKINDTESDRGIKVICN